MNSTLENQLNNPKVRVSIREILIINKRSGLPIFYRVYGEPTGKDPVLIAGLLTAIIRFGEEIGNNFELNDIGIQRDVRIFVRSERRVVCVLIFDRFTLLSVESPLFVEIVNEIATRVFSVINMLFVDQFLEPLTPLEETLGISYEDPIDEILSELDETKLKKFPGIGEIIDNIILESTMIFELEEFESDEEIDEILASMELEDTTYLGSDYTGISKDIESNQKRLVQDLISRISSSGNNEEEE